jgi:ubiquitin related modifier 1
MSVTTVKVEFGGGLELLFDNKRTHQLTLPHPPSKEGVAEQTKATDVTYLIHWLKDNLLRERPELFVEEGTV